MAKKRTEYWRKYYKKNKERINLKKRQRKLAQKNKINFEFFEPITKEDREIFNNILESPKLLDESDYEDQDQDQGQYNIYILLLIILLIIVGVISLILLKNII